MAIQIRIVHIETAPTFRNISKTERQKNSMEG